MLKVCHILRTKAVRNPCHDFFETDFGPSQHCPAFGRGDFVMNSTTSQPEGSTRVGEIDAIREPGATHCAVQAASVDWAYGMPLSYVQEMASHWLSLYDRTMRPAPGGSTHCQGDDPDRDND
jgi:hypothetical protein